LSRMDEKTPRFELMNLERSISYAFFFNATEDMSIVCEEIFGPVCSFSKSKTRDEAISLGNNTTYGLAALE
jgi:aldehyde dehydrogenase (NAD+)